MARDIDLIWGSGEAEYFCKWDWTGQITLIRFRKFLLARTRRSPDRASERVAPTGRANARPMTGSASTRNDATRHPSRQPTSAAKL
jgi:hypothetical protein